MTFQKICALEFLKKPLVENVIHDISKNVCFGISKKPLVENVIHDISKNVCFGISNKLLVENVIHDISKNVCYLFYTIKNFTYKNF